MLWPETIQALKNITKSDDLVFYAPGGSIWFRTIKSIGKTGREKYTKENAVSKKFSKLLKKTGIKTEKGVGFYTLRRTAAALAAKSGAPFAVQRLLGHAELKMATTYVQDVSEQTDRVINNSRKKVILNLWETPGAGGISRFIWKWPALFSFKILVQTFPFNGVMTFLWDFTVACPSERLVAVVGHILYNLGMMQKAR